MLITNDEPLITVAVPCYNHEKFVVQLLSSIYESDWKNIELLVLDDGSKDDSFTIVSDWIANHKSRFTRAISMKQTNIGISATLNKLISIAEGEFIAIIASDDLMDTNSLRTRAAALNSACWADAVFSNSRVISETGAILNDRIYSEIKEIAYQKLGHQFIELLFAWNGCGPGLMLRNKKYSSEAYFCEKLFFEDLEFFLRLSMKGKLCYTPCVLQSYRRVSDSAGSAKKNVEILESTFYSSLKTVAKNANSWQWLLINLVAIRINLGKSRSRWIRLAAKLTFGIPFRIILVSNRFSLQSLDWSHLKMRV